jgi:predicted nucleic acid-binding Zn ribbon protein
MHEFFQGINDKLKKKCPNCGKLKLIRIISGGIRPIFKGSGFYQTDYKDKNDKNN